jgi:hypothetical protein
MQSARTPSERDGNRYSIRFPRTVRHRWCQQLARPAERSKDFSLEKVVLDRVQVRAVGWPVGEERAGRRDHPTVSHTARKKA